ncbi:MAG: hypothetical protein JWP57_942 [Spirosoma sp.]|nr:hypothetical protein [Spirosoma sp.]
MRLKLLAYFILISAVLAGCSKSKSDPKPPDYSGKYNVTISSSHSIDNGPFTQPQVESGQVVVSEGSKPNTLIFTNDQGDFEVTFVGDSFSIPTQTDASNDYTITTVASGKFTATGFEFTETETETTKVSKSVYKRETIGTKL